LLAVVPLGETGAYAWELRMDPSWPLSGYCLVSGDPAALLVSAYLENLRPPGRSGPELHAWALTTETAVSLGSLTDPEAVGSTLTYACNSSAEHLKGATGVWITAGLAGPMGIPVLEGPLVWLRTEAQPAEPLPAPLDSSDPPEASVPVEASEVPGDMSPVPDASAESLVPEEEALLAHLTAQTTIEPPVLEDALAPFTVPLASQHPLAPRAGGTAVLSPRTGALTVTVRGLPNAATLGRDPYTGHPFSGYRAWLVSQRTRTRVSAGLCTRIWGENYRLQVDAGLPLCDYDAVLITAVDRNASTSSPDAPRVLLGPYKISE